MRQKWIDNAKGIAMLLVILGHLAGGLPGFWNFEFVNGFHLVTFFLLSGYTMKKKVFDRTYAGEKFTRLMRPYFLTCLAVLAADIINTRFIARDSSIMTVTNIIFKDLLRSFFASGSHTAIGSAEMGVRIGAIWFFPAMFFALMIFQGFLQITEDHKTLGIYSLAAAAAGHLSARFIWFPFSIQAGLTGVLFLYIGYVIRERALLTKVRPADYLIAAVSLALVVIGGYSAVFLVRANIRDYIFSMVGALSGFLLIYLASVSLKNARILPKIGMYSSTILCMHLFSLECMPRVFSFLLDDTLALQGIPREVLKIIVYMLFAVLAGFAAEWLKTKIRPKEAKGQTGRDTAVDIAKGILIIMMVAGHFDMDPGLRTVIYSCHMAGFIFFSGYFYRQNKSVGQTFLRMCRTFLIPYGTAAFLNLLMHYGQWSPEYISGYVIQYLAGISFARNLFADIPSVGPIYFILLLFAARMLYTVIDHLIPSRRYKYLAVIAVSAAGYYLGNAGYWLPWSFDAACFCILFYWFGVLAAQYQVLRHIRQNSPVYFLLSAVWAYMIWRGGMELAVRNYGNYGLTAAGALAGTLLIYQLSALIADKQALLSGFLSRAGSSTLYILVIHTVFRKQVFALTSLICHEGYFGYFLVSILLQVVLGILAGSVIQMVKSTGRKA